MSRSRYAVYYGLVVLLVGLWVLYFVSPMDLLPDMIPGIGRLDDLLALVGLYWSLRRLRLRVDSHTARGYSAHGEATTEELRNDADPVASETPWQVLQVAPGASPEELHAAYKQQLLKYHPDRVAHLG
jgi:uncharacterized membrane protein YkvA (DUF1232 family)